MQAAELADILNARRAGSGRWTARCPAHSDRSPSLSITQGHTGVLLRCWSHGCTPEAICSALGLTLRDLFTESGATPEQRRQSALESAQRDAERKAAHCAESKRNAELLRLERLRDSLGAKLALLPNDAKLGKLFHEICAKLHEMESSEPQDEDGPLCSESTPAIPQWIADALTDISRSFAPNNEKAARMAA